MPDSGLLVKVSLFAEPIEVESAHEIQVLRGQGVYEYTVGGEGDPAAPGEAVSKKSAPAKAAPASSKER